MPPKRVPTAKKTGNKNTATSSSAKEAPEGQLDWLTRRPGAVLADENFCLRCLQNVIGRYKDGDTAIPELDCGFDNVASSRCTRCSRNNKSCGTVGV